MPSHRANKWGTKAEKYAVERYDLDLDRSSWHDATRNGRPVEIKSCRHTHADGQKGNFKVYEQYHRKLRRHDGSYVFVLYRVRSGFDPIRAKLVHSSRVPRLSWHGGGDHRNTRQAKLAFGDVF